MNFDLPNLFLRKNLFVTKYSKLIAVSAILIIYLFIMFFTNKIINEFYYQEIKNDLLIKSDVIEKKLRNILLREKNGDKEDQAVLVKLVNNLNMRLHTQIDIYRCNHQTECIIYSYVDDLDKDDKNKLRSQEIEKVGRLGGNSFYVEIEKDLMMDKNKKKLNLLSSIRDNKTNTIFVLKISQVITGLNNYWTMILTVIYLLPMGLLLLICLLVAKKIESNLEEIKKRKKIVTCLNDRIDDSDSNNSIYKTTVSLNQLVNNLLRQKQQLDAFFSSMSEGVLAIDNNDHVLYLNRAVIRLFELEDDDYSGKYVYEICEFSICYDFISNIKNSRGHVVREVILSSVQSQDFTASGNVTNKTFQLSGVPLYDHVGDRIGILIIISDISKAKEIEKQHQDFVSNVAHELKTPITSIKGFVDTIFDQNVTDKEEIFKYLNIVRRQSERLISIIDDLLTLSLLQHKRAKLEFTSVSLFEMIEESIDICSLKLNTKKIDINVICNKHVVLKVNIPLFEQAMVNLIDNAIKYSNDHSRIDIVVNDGDAINVCDGNELVIAVEDKGIGIPANDLDHIFERFYRVDKTRSRKSGGTGLGLAIVKHIVDIHNGKTWVKSIKGKGSTFYISVPRNS
ncbi:MAG: PAS domain S-box protein [Oligoflexia bacterium]|nr:PAS domain S-box protein [Oligoflexia bacterium]